MTKKEYEEIISAVAYRLKSTANNGDVGYIEALTDTLLKLLRYEEYVEKD